jgi:hypothetical protein
LKNRYPVFLEEKPFKFGTNFSFGNPYSNKVNEELDIKSKIIEYMIERKVKFGSKTFEQSPLSLLLREGNYYPSDLIDLLIIGKKIKKKLK